MKHFIGLSVQVDRGLESTAAEFYVTEIQVAEHMMYKARLLGPQLVSNAKR